MTVIQPTPPTTQPPPSSRHSRQRSASPSRRIRVSSQLDNSDINAANNGITPEEVVSAPPSVTNNKEPTSTTPRLTVLPPPSRSPNIARRRLVQSPTAIENNINANTLPITATVAEPARSRNNTNNSTVYPALISQVSEAFQSQVVTRTYEKNGEYYSDAFIGKDGVDAICNIIHTTDRNLSLLLGRSLDAQKFFHDVEHRRRLRDTPSEIYQFNSNTNGSRPCGVFTLLTDCYSPTCTRERLCYSLSCPRRLEQQMWIAANSKSGSSEDSKNETKRQPESSSLPSMSNSSTLTTSSNATTTLEPLQIKTLTTPSLPPKRPSVSAQVLWSTSVPPSILSKVPEKERKRQEIMFELIQTEVEYIEDLQSVYDLVIVPLSTTHRYISTSILSSTASTSITASTPKSAPQTPITSTGTTYHPPTLVSKLFLNMPIVLELGRHMLTSLITRQSASMTPEHSYQINTISDIFMNFFDPRQSLFDAYLEYGKNLVWSKYWFDTEKATNESFSKFIQDVERKPEFRKLSIQSFLTRPTTRLGRYILLLEHIQKNTFTSDMIDLAITQLKTLLTKINIEAGLSDNKLRLFTLHKSLVYQSHQANSGAAGISMSGSTESLSSIGMISRNGSQVSTNGLGLANQSATKSEVDDLKLLDENRVLVREGRLVVKKAAGAEMELTVFLFDHMLVLTKKKKNGLFKIYKKPIPLELLIIAPEKQSMPQNLSRSTPSLFKSDSFLGIDFRGSPSNNTQQTQQQQQQHHHHQDSPSRQTASLSRTNIPVHKTGSPAHHDPLLASMKHLNLNSPPVSALSGSTPTQSPLSLNSSHPSQNDSLPHSASRRGMNLMKANASTSSPLLTITNISSPQSSIAQTDSSNKYSFTISHLGRPDSTYTLHGSSIAERSIWVDAITTQKQLREERNKRFTLDIMAELVFSKSENSGKKVENGEHTFGPKQQPIHLKKEEEEEEEEEDLETSRSSTSSREKVLCSTMLENGRLLFGTENGVYVCMDCLKNQNGAKVTGKVFASYDAGSNAIVSSEDDVVSSASDDENIGDISFASLSDAPVLKDSFTKRKPSHKRRVKKVLDVWKVSQMDVLKETNCLLVLADKTLLSFPLDLIFPDNTQANSPSTDASSKHTKSPSKALAEVSKKGKKLVSNVSFFKIGTCNNRKLVCAVRSAALSSTIKTLEPLDATQVKKRTGLGKLFGNNESMRIYKEFYIPTESTSIHFLKTKLCVGCTKGFEIVDLESLNTQGLLDPTDESLDFILKKENVTPISIFRTVDGEFILCYNEFGFYVDRLGRRSRHDFFIQWSGTPTSFAYSHPYIIAFEQAFIEIRHVYTGEIQQVIQTSHLRCLNTNPDCLQCVMDQKDKQAVFRLNFLEEFVQERGLRSTLHVRSNSSSGM